MADHTGVPESLRGQGIALALVERLVADAGERTGGLKPGPVADIRIVSTCLQSAGRCIGVVLQSIA